MKQTITLSPKGQPGTIAIFEYDLDTGIMNSMTFSDGCTLNFKKFVTTHMPLSRLWLQDDSFKKYESKDITEFDLSFAAFWDMYAVKMGNKGRVEKKWNALSDEDKTAAICAIQKYKKYADRTKTDRCFPEMYLNGRRWENEF